jgi:hypothetical protein
MENRILNTNKEVSDIEDDYDLELSDDEINNNEETDEESVNEDEIDNEIDDYVKATNDIIQNINQTVKSSLSDKVQTRIERDLTEINNGYDSKIKVLNEEQDEKIIQLENLYAQQKQNVECERQQRISLYYQEMQNRIEEILQSINEDEDSIGAMKAWINRIKTFLFIK